MRRSIEALTLAVVFAAAFACGGGGGEEADTGVAEEEQAGPVVSPDSAATITGVVNFTGTPPGMDPIDMSEEPTCAEQHPEPPPTQSVVATEGTLANDFIYVKVGLGDRVFPTPSEGVTIDQHG